MDEIAACSIEVKINGTSPETTKAGDVAEILESIEDMLTSCVSIKHPQIKKEEIVIGLVNIKSSSLGLELVSPNQQEVLSAFR
ncbi:MAG: hypothetical protein HYX83_00480, partial [Chloroflexi bacterium]|nr:hypothetical protein [Chloroflexota bacterium]